MMMMPIYARNARNLRRSLYAFSQSTCTTDILSRRKTTYTRPNQSILYPRKLCRCFPPTHSLHVAVSNLAWLTNYFCVRSAPRVSSRGFLLVSEGSLFSPVLVTSGYALPFVC